MAGDIFSSFDDHQSSVYFSSALMWGVPMLGMFFISIFWSGLNLFSAMLKVGYSVVWGLVSGSKVRVLGGTSFYITLFILLASLNLWGLVPFVFSLTSHLAVNLQISLPVWFGIVLMSVTYNLGDFLSHLQPMGAPAPLSPFLCIIELVSLLVRPITLAVRLTANLSTGHILMALLGTGFMLQMWLVILGMFYFLFEMGVCGVQSYIFTLLPTLYSDDHS